MKRILIASIILLLITGCGPAKIEGDVFLVKGDGKPQPSAAKEVIFIKAESFEDILIESYLESVQEDTKRNAEVVTNLCNSASTLMISEKEKTQDTLNGRMANGKTNNVTDQDGSCALIQKQFDEASSAATSSRNNFDELISKEQRKKTNAMAELMNLQNKLEQKISSREKTLYEDFSSGIEITLETSRWVGKQLTVLNNTKYNIRIEGDICLQFSNAEGGDVGHVSTASSLGDCSAYSSSNYKAKGTLLNSNAINAANTSKDEFGFYRGGYLPKRSKVNAGRDNYFCKRGLRPSETLRLTKKYGTDKDGWPDLSSPDPSKGYKIRAVNPVRSKSYDGDKEACGIENQDGIAKFIALKDEVRIENGNTIRYVSEPIKFREIAKAEIYEERDLIKVQEEIIRITEKEIQSITDRSIENLLLVNELDARSNLDQCSELTAKNELDQELIAWMDVSLGQMQKCDLGDAGLFETLLNVGLSSVDNNQLDSILETNYSSKAAYAALKRFADSEYKTSTNISGHYVIDKLPRGNYVAYSSYRDNFIEGIYLENIEITGEAQVDFSNTKFHEVGSLSSVIDIFYEDCSSKICSESDLRYTLDMNEAERRYEKRKEELEDIEESIRELERLFKKY